MEEYKIRLIEETKELATKTNKLNDFMKTNFFYKLPRNKKDLLYEQYQLMVSYLRVLGLRLELEEIDLEKENFFE
jgi:hypothetical protein